MIVGLNYRITWDATNSRYTLATPSSNAGLFFKFGSVVGIYSANHAIQILPATTSDAFDAGDVAWTPTANIPRTLHPRAATIPLPT